MSSNAQNPDNNGSLYVFGFFLLLFVAGWWIFHDPLVRFVFGLHRVVFHVGYLLIGWYTDAPLNYLAVTEIGMDAPKRVTFKAFMQVVSEGGRYLRWLVIPVLAYLAWKIHKHPIQKYKGRMDVNKFLQRQSVTWKPIVPILHMDLVKAPPKAWRSPYRSHEVAEKLRLTINRKLNPERVQAYLEKQLGAKLDPDNLDRLKPYEKALFAVFALRIVRERLKSDPKVLAGQALLDDLNESTRGTGVPNYALAMPYFERLKSDSRVLDAIRPHRYVRTALVQMLCKAKEFDGVLPPSQFVWLRPIDLVLFLALNRAPIVPERLHAAAFVEAAAVMNQWQAERVAALNELRMIKPFVLGAMDGIKEDLESKGVVTPDQKEPSPSERTGPRRNVGRVS